MATDQQQQEQHEQAAIAALDNALAQSPGASGGAEAAAFDPKKICEEYEKIKGPINQALVAVEAVANFPLIPKNIREILTKLVAMVRTLMGIVSGVCQLP